MGFPRDFLRALAEGNLEESVFLPNIFIKSIILHFIGSGISFSLSLSLVFHSFSRGIGMSFPFPLWRKWNGFSIPSRRNGMIYVLHQAILIWYSA